MKPVAILESPLGIVAPAEQAPSDATREEAARFEALVDEPEVEAKAGGEEDLQAETSSDDDSDDDCTAAFGQVLLFQLPLPAAAESGVAAVAAKVEVSTAPAAAAQAAAEPAVLDESLPPPAALPEAAADEAAIALEGVADEAATATKESGATQAAPMAARVATSAAEPVAEPPVEVKAPDEVAAPAGASAQDGETSDQAAGGDLAGEVIRLADKTKSDEDARPSGVFALYEAASAATTRPTVAADQAVLARNVSQQLSQSVAGKPDGTVELTLSPDELGHVKVVMRHEDGGMAVTIQADRQETLDLMRRHIDMLARDFRDLGYADVSFSFSDNRGGQQPSFEAASNEQTLGSEGLALPETPTSQIAPSLTVAAIGLDLRM